MLNNRPSKYMKQNCICMYLILLIHFLIRGHLGCFQLSGFVTTAAMNMAMQISAVIYNICDSALKRNETLTHAASWTNMLEDIMLSKTSQSLKDTL